MKLSEVRDLPAGTWLTWSTASGDHFGTLLRVAGTEVLVDPVTGGSSYLRARQVSLASAEQIALAQGRAARHAARQAARDAELEARSRVCERARRMHVLGASVRVDVPYDPPCVIVRARTAADAERILDALESAGRGEPRCQCQWEIGDSPCRVHGEDEEATHA